MSRPLVSIIIPCSRQAHYLGAAIGGTLGQSYPAIQVVVVDDGSDDDTEAVAGRISKATQLVGAQGGRTSDLLSLWSPRGMAGTMATIGLEVGNPGIDRGLINRINRGFPCLSASAGIRDDEPSLR